MIRWCTTARSSTVWTIEAQWPHFSQLTLASHASPRHQVLILLCFLVGQFQVTVIPFVNLIVLSLDTILIMFCNVSGHHSTSGVSSGVSSSLSEAGGAQRSHGGPPQGQTEEAISWHLASDNKRFKTKSSSTSKKKKNKPTPLSLS